MDKEQYIKIKFRDLIKETLEERSSAISNKLNKNKFDYIEEGKSMCESCGGEMKEGENCENCGGGRGKEIMELGGMDDGHPKFGKMKFGKMSSEEIERLLRGDDEDDKTSSNMRSRRKNSISKSKTNSDSMSRSQRYQKDDDMNEETDNNEFDFVEIDEKLDSSMSNQEFDSFRKKEDQELYEISFDKDYTEVEEGNGFGYAVSKAKKLGKDKFSFDGKSYNVKESILYTQTDLINLIENLVIEEKNKFKVKEPKGYQVYNRVHKADKKENDNYLKSVAKKMTDYIKGSSDSGTKYEMKQNKKFPTQNGGMKKGNRKKYTPSDAVDDYLDAFSYPGQTNLRYDEIKPNDKNIEKYLKGHRTTGNAQVDDDGNALGNVVPSDVGEKFYNNYKENLYGKEQSDASYKRQTQPVDLAGEDTQKGKLKTKKGKTPQSILSNLDESIDSKKTIKLNEEFDRIQSLMSYDRKTQ